MSTDIIMANGVPTQQRQLLASAPLAISPPSADSFHANANSPASDTPTGPDSPLQAEGPLTKNWVIPDRPKPGRKPAQDTPPTKRKEQNRAAQRAFRERRAARVQELEGILQEATQKHQDQVQSLHRHWEQEKDGMRTEIATWRARFEEAQRTVQHQRMQTEYFQRECEQIRQAYRWSASSASTNSTVFSHSSGSRASTEIVSPKSYSGFPSATMLPVPPRIPPALGQKASSKDAPPRDCPNCGKFGCLDPYCSEKLASSLPDVEQKGMTTSTETTPASHHSTPAVSRGSTAASSHDLATPKAELSNEMEIDYTTRFAKPSTRATAVPQQDDPAAVSFMQDFGKCGFCSDGTPCLCAESQKRDETLSTVTLSSALPKPQPIEPGPGSCASCRDDPLQRAFCLNLSSYSSSSRANAPNQQPKHAHPTNGGSTLPRLSVAIDGRMSCADAYNALRRDIPDFAQHVNDRELYEQLRPRKASAERECKSCNCTGCAPFEVERHNVEEAATALASIRTSDPGKYRVSR